jgi:uncharacterized membrane protein
MFGVRGLDGFGLVHAAIGILALLLGLAVILLGKGTRLHRKVGFAYLMAMAALNVTALWIFDLTGRFGGFHIAAIISLATILAGYLPVVFRRPRQWMPVHGIFMGWSYVGLVAAFLSEIAVRVPGVGFSTGLITTTIMAIGGGALLIHTRVPVIARRISSRAVEHPNRRL